MPTVVVLSTADPVTEPVTVADAVVEWRLDLVATDTDEAAQAERRLIQRKLAAARQLVEAYTGRYVAGGQTLELTFRLDEEYKLPTGAVATAVRGFHTSLASLENFHWVEYLKGSSVERQWPLGYAAQQTYTVTVTLPETASSLCPALMQEAILELGAEFYRNRETSSAAGIVPRELPVSYKVKLAPLVLHPALF
ncbi:hypothetical protein [Hymenobacter mucosus]|uniref:Phage gp6-like head-tail connector protein n=1 Tax=Hymenobacter mucosus TaxID=1411120 RepID=A0A239A9R8_9BACT|nr:hypothetical protein [Hymenobacter mucosus]SNR92320.1 hypothetical protein SAMN06269173_11191 [Hymenobacter mucosus]